MKSTAIAIEEKIDALLDCLDKDVQRLQDGLLQLDELRRWQEVTLGREGRVLELKQEINALLAEFGRPERYLSAEAHAETAPLSPHTQPRDG